MESGMDSKSCRPFTSPPGVTNGKRMRPRGSALRKFKIAIAPSSWPHLPTESALWVMSAIPTAMAEFCWEKGQKNGSKRHKCQRLSDRFPKSADHEEP